MVIWRGRRRRGPSVICEEEIKEKIYLTSSRTLVFGREGGEKKGMFHVQLFCLAPKVDGRYGEGLLLLSSLPRPHFQFPRAQVGKAEEFFWHVPHSEYKKREMGKK